MLASEIWLTPQQDAYVAEYYPDENFGQQSFLYANRYVQAGDRYRTYMQFNLNAAPKIPVNSCIRYAYLKLPVYRNEIPSTNTLYAYRVLQHWCEDQITWNTQPVIALPPDGMVEVNSGFKGIITMEVTALVRWWHIGMYKNFGIMITCEEEENSLVGFFSKEYPNSDYWPRLKIGYTENCCVKSRCECECEYECD